jgi:hypothetical protein
MVALEEIKPGSRLRGLDPEGIAEVVQVARFGADALNLVFRVNGRVGERLVYRGEETAFEQIDAGRAETKNSCSSRSAMRSAPLSLKSGLTALQKEITYLSLSAYRWTRSGFRRWPNMSPRALGVFLRERSGGRLKMRMVVSPFALFFVYY